MRHSGPALGDIVGAIIVIAVFAVTTPILVYMYVERADLTTGIISERIDRQSERVGEQVDVSGVKCGVGGLESFIHNYGSTTFESGKIESYKILNGTIGNLTNAKFSGLDGTVDPQVESGDTILLWADIDCDTERVLLLMPTGTSVVIGQ